MNDKLTLYFRSMEQLESLIDCLNKIRANGYLASDSVNFISVEFPYNTLWHELTIGHQFHNEGELAEIVVPNTIHLYNGDNITIVKVNDADD